MPSGKTHDKVTYFFVLPVFLGVWFVSHHLIAAVVSSLTFLFAGLMFSGDLDTKSVQYKRWGPLKWIWIPYQKMVTHRSPFSHGILLGMMARLAYLTLILSLVFVAVTRLALWLEFGQFANQSFQTIHGAVDLLRTYPTVFWSGLLGLWLGGASHTLADETVSFWKRRRRKRLKKKKKYNT